MNDNKIFSAIKRGFEINGLMTVNTPSAGKALHELLNNR